MGSRVSDARLLKALTPLVGLIDSERMRGATYAGRRDGDKLTLAAAAMIA